MPRIKLLLLVGLCFLSKSVYAQWLDPQWKSTVVLFELQTDKENYRAIGTGFLVIYEREHFVVTNRHIAEHNHLFIRLNLKSNEEASLRYSIDKLKDWIGLQWILSPNDDVAILPFLLYPEVQSYRDSIDIKAIGFSMFKDWNYINEGDDIFVLGFPMRVGAGKHFSPVVRSGIVSLKEKRGEFLIDSNIYPGNSGGPVFTKTGLFDYRTGTLGGGQDSGYLIGIVSSYIPYIDSGVSQQTGRVRITFEENSGLARILSTEHMVDLMKLHLSKLQKQK